LKHVKVTQAIQLCNHTMLITSFYHVNYWGIVVTDISVIINGQGMKKNMKISYYILRIACYDSHIMTLKES